MNLKNKVTLYGILFLAIAVQFCGTQASAPKEGQPKKMISIEKELLFFAKNRPPIRVFERAGEGLLLALNPIKGVYATSPYFYRPEAKDYTVLIKEIDTGKIVHALKAHNGPVEVAAFSPDGEALATASADGLVRIWNVSTGKSIAGMMLDTGNLVWSPDSKRIATTVKKGSKIWDSSFSGEIQLSLPDAWPPLAFAPPALGVAPIRRIAAGTSPLPLENTPALWNAIGGEKIGDFEGSMSGITSFAFSPNGFLLAVGGHDGSVEVWDSVTQKMRYTLIGHKDHITNVVFSFDGKMIATASWDLTIKLWDVGSRQEIETLSGLDSYPIEIAFSPNDQLLYALTKRKLSVYNVSGQFLQKVKKSLDQNLTELISRAYALSTRGKSLQVEEDSEDYKALMGIDDPDVRSFLVKSLRIKGIFA